MRVMKVWGLAALVGLAFAVPQSALGQEPIAHEDEASIATTSRADGSSEPPPSDAVETPSTDYDPAPPGRIARRFSLLVGLGFTHNAMPLRSAPDIGFYGRLTEWASIGLRMRGWIAASSSDGALIDLALAAPSVRLHFREDLNSWASIEVGIHVEGGLGIRWSENGTADDRLRFGMGAGVFATLELGEVSAVQLDYTLNAHGLGARSFAFEGTASLSYVARWD